jgi:hypothetical protein
METEKVETKPPFTLLLVREFPENPGQETKKTPDTE